MSDLKFSDNLFLGKEELNHLKASLSDDGYEQFLKHMIQTYGIGRLATDASFDSFKVIAGSGGGNITIQAGFAFDNSLNIIENPSNSVDAFNIPSDSVPRFIIISNDTSVLEEGTVSVDASGGLTGTGTLFTQVLRGGPDFPSKINFPSAVSNTGEYLVASVTDDLNAQLNVPANSLTAENDLAYRIVGTFTPGVIPSTSDKYPFEKNFFSAISSTTNTSDGLTSFVLASVVYDGITLTITDLRTNNLFSTKEELSFQTSSNLLVGLEQVTYEGDKSPKDQNLAKLGWGFRSTTGNWSFNATNQQITITAGAGGIWDDKTTFVNGDFDDWYVFVKDDGQNIRIVSSALSSGDIVLNVESTQSVLTTSEIVVHPDADSIEFLFTSSSLTGIKAVAFPIHQGEAQIPIEAGVTHTIFYRHIREIDSTAWALINDGNYVSETQALQGSGTTPYTGGQVTTVLNALNHEDDKASRSLTNLYTGPNVFQAQVSFGEQIFLEYFDDTLSVSNFAYTEFDDQHMVRITTSVSGTIGGIVGGVTGKIAIIHNSTASTTPIFLLHEEGLATAVNRMSLPFDKRIELAPGGFVTLIYDEEPNRWLVMNSAFLDDWVDRDLDTGDLTLSGGGTTSFGATNKLKYKIIDGTAHVQIDLNITVSAALTQVVWAMPTVVVFLIGPSTTKNITQVPGTSRIGGTNEDSNVWLEPSTDSITFRPPTGGTTGTGSAVQLLASLTWALG